MNKNQSAIENPYDHFAKWLERQPYWIQDAVWNLYNKRSIDSFQISKYAQMCLDQSEGKMFTYQHLDKAVFSNLQDESKVTVNSIHDINYVNALAGNTRLDFEPEGVSVVYGLNGSGKSGFMRIFKHVSGHPYAEPIRQNVYNASDDNKPSCKIDISIGNFVQTIDTDLEVPGENPYLKQFDVFDTRISSAYISNSNSASYEPFIFTVLKELAVTAGKIQEHIQSKIDSIQKLNIARPEFLISYTPSNWIETISETTVIPRECYYWDDSDEKRIAELNKLLDSEQVLETIKSKEYQLNQIEEIFIELKAIEERIKANTCGVLQNRYEDFSKAYKQYELANAVFNQNATKLDQKSVKIEDFRVLWKAGRAYYENCIHEINENEFAQPGSICPLCLQRIEGEKLERFASVDEYVNGAFSEAYTTAEEEYTKIILSIIEHTYTATQIKSTLTGIVDEKITYKIIEFYNKLDRWSKNITSETTYNEIIGTHELEFVSELNDIKDEISEEIDLLKSALSIKKQDEYNTELLHLRYRQWVFQQKELINTIILNDKQKNKLESSLQFVKTNKITSESNQLAEALITDAYIRRFNKEMSILAPRLKVKLEKVQSQKGRSPYKVVLDAQNKLRKNPEDVLSEGEQRIVALAAFFADATGRDEKTPIIIDDPISSLDLNFENAATKRIVELAKDRQVIVFTHRISLLVGLSEECESRDIPFGERYIRGTDVLKGIPDYEDVYHGKLTAQLNGLIDRLQTAKEMDPYSREYQDACSRISQQLRICIERSVEDILFQKMVRRFSRRIMTGKLMKMSQITADDCAIIDLMMTKYSYGEHSQPIDSPSVELDIDNTIVDVRNFITWIKAYNKRMG